MNNTLTYSKVPILSLDDSHVSLIADEISQHAHALKLKVAFLGNSSDLDNLERSRLSDSFSECWFCHSLPELFRLNLDNLCDLFVVFNQIEHSSIDDIKKLLTLRKGTEAHVTQIDSSNLAPEQFYSLINKFSEYVSRKECIDSYLEESFSSLDRGSDIITHTNSEITNENYRNKIREALWDKFSQSPELFLKEEIKNIRS